MNGNTLNVQDIDGLGTNSPHSTPPTEASVATRALPWSVQTKIHHLAKWNREPLKDGWWT